MLRPADVEIVNLHSPIAPAPELAKVRTHEAVAAYLATRPPAPRVLCGDLNTPRRELPDGDVLTFAHDSAGRLRPERGERWDRAERALVHALRASTAGSTPSARCTATSERHASWTFAHDRGGWRLDHVLAHGLRPRRERVRARVAPGRPQRPLGARRRPRASAERRRIAHERAQRRVVAREAQRYPRLVEVPLALEAERARY